MLLLLLPIITDFENRLRIEYEQNKKCNQSNLTLSSKLEFDQYFKKYKRMSLNFPREANLANFSVESETKVESKSCFAKT